MEYDRDRVARLFNGMAGERNALGEQTFRAGTIITQLAGRLALEGLELRSHDVLLDAGTGTGEKAIVAARICRQVIGIDISQRSLSQARMSPERQGLKNVAFAYGEFEDPCTELDLASYGITKILAVYSLHHLPNPMKERSLLILAELLHRPGRMAIGDIMFFEDPSKHREQFDEACYDAGDTDFPASAQYLTGCLERMGAGVHIDRIHPLVGVVMADFV